MNPRLPQSLFLGKPMRGLLVAALLSVSALAPGAASTTPLRLENEHYLVEVCPTNGAISRIRDQQRGLELIQEPRLADNFKFTLPIRREFAWQSTEGNFILGRDQRLTSHRHQDSRLELAWGGPMRSSLGKSYRVSAMMALELEGEDLRFDLKIHNRSKLEIGEVYYPILGGMHGLGTNAETRRQTQLVVPEALAIHTAPVFRAFANMSWLGVFGPEQYYPYPNRLSMPWAEFRQPALDRSVYFGAHDPTVRYKVLHLEMCPGVAPGRADGNWPRPEELQGVPAGVKVCFVHMAYEPPEGDFAATPVVLRFHDGDWHRGARIYGEWLKSESGHRRREEADHAHTPLAPPHVGGCEEDWFSRSPAFQQCEAVPFKDLPRWAKAAAGAGVPAMLLNRWSTGGAGNALPRFEPDPRLGTTGEFVDALRQCHTLGVKVGVVVNLTPISLSLEKGKSEFHRYAAEDRWGIPYTTIGVFETSSLTGGMGAGERCVWLNPGNPGLRRKLLRQIKPLVELGVDGVHFQSFFARPVDFNPECGRTPDRAVWEGGLETLREIRETCRAIRPDFAVSTDSAWDGALDLSRAGFVEARDLCALRVAAPGWRPLFTLADDDAFAAINNALRYGGRVRLAPVDNQPLGGPATAGILDYLRVILSARETLKATLRDGETVEPETIKAERATVRSVFRNPENGLRTAILVNPGAEARTVQFHGFMPPGSLPAQLWLPTAGGATNALPGMRFDIPGRQLALLTEETAANRLPAIERAPAPARNQRVVFDLASVEDLDGWTLKGAFSIGTVPGLIPRPTLNSLASGGESSTGIAISPPFRIDPQFDTVEIVIQGGWSEEVNGAENLVLKLVDAATGELLAEVLPPGVHELRTVRRSVGSFHDRTVRVELNDSNRNSSYAWIGLRKVILIGPRGGADAL